MKVKQLARQILHEIGVGKHRIVVVSSEQTVSGQWADLSALAELNGMLANAGASKQLPSGIFRVAQVIQQVLA